ncbi:MAG: GTP-dependent dephospho-CoA kinase family protein [Nitrososphaeraceae archaeon]
MPIKNEDLDVLKKPFGKLFQNNQLTEEKIIEIIGNIGYVVTVGDATTEIILSYGIVPKISIIDRRERRKKRNNIEKIMFYYNKYNKGKKINKHNCKNPAGSITKEAYSLIKKLIKRDEFSIIIVEGEEDLLALPIFCLAPEKSIVMYGQPLEGLVIVSIDKKIRTKAQVLLNNIGLK